MMKGIATPNSNSIFFVDDIKLENGKRGDRVSSQIYHQVVQYLQQRPETKDLDNELQLLH